MNLLALVFIYVSGLMIENVSITQCGRPMLSTCTLYPNDITLYFHESVNDIVCELFLSNQFLKVSININNNVTLHNVNITFMSGIAQKSKKIASQLWWIRACTVL